MKILLGAFSHTYENIFLGKKKQEVELLSKRDIYTFKLTVGISKLPSKMVVPIYILQFMTTPSSHT